MSCKDVRALSVLESESRINYVRTAQGVIGGGHVMVSLSVKSEADLTGNKKLVLSWE